MSPLGLVYFCYPCEGCCHLGYSRSAQHSTQTWHWCVHEAPTHPYCIANIARSMLAICTSAMLDVTLTTRCTGCVQFDARHRCELYFAARHTCEGGGSCGGCWAIISFNSCPVRLSVFKIVNAACLRASLCRFSTFCSTKCMLSTPMHFRGCLINWGYKPPK